jgi:hypothetical protein
MTQMFKRKQAEIPYVEMQTWANVQAFPEIAVIYGNPTVRPFSRFKFLRELPTRVVSAHSPLREAITQVVVPALEDMALNKLPGSEHIHKFKIGQHSVRVWYRKGHGEYAYGQVRLLFVRLEHRSNEYINTHQPSPGIR